MDVNNIVKEELARQAEAPAPTTLKKSMTIAELIKAMEPEIKRALPKSITAERFTRMALSALNTTPKLQECTQISFLSALMNAAQLGLEPNTPLGQAYLIPYKNKGVYECQFQVGYKGLLDLAYRSPQLQTVQAHCVYENDTFSYELGLNPQLVHKPTMGERGELRCVYAVFKTNNGGYGFEVMSKSAIEAHGKQYSKSYDSSYSPWKTDFEAMAKKTVIKQALKYAPVKTDYVQAVTVDDTTGTEIPDYNLMDNVIDSDYREVT